MVKFRLVAVLAVTLLITTSCVLDSREPVVFSSEPTSDEQKQEILESVLPACEPEGFVNMCSTLVVDTPIPAGTTAAELSEQAYDYLSIKVITSDELSRTVISGLPQLDEVGERRIVSEVAEGEFLDEAMFSPADDT